MPVIASLLSVSMLWAGTAAEQTLRQSLSEMFETIAADFIAAARQMPADEYAYRPTPAVRTFGQIVAHVAGSQFLYCAQAAGRRFDGDVIARLEPVRRYSERVEASTGEPVPSREALVALLDEGVAYCRTALGEMTDAQLVETVTSRGRERIRARPFLENIAHTNEHYGNIVTYLRERGLVPPSTQRNGQPAR
jgi:uncharacterized damage-inducible protein DinB